MYPHFGQGILQRENGRKIAAGAHISFFEIFQPCKRRNVLRGEIRRYDAFALSVEALSVDGDVPENVRVRKPAFYRPQLFLAYLPSAQIDGIGAARCGGSVNKGILPEKPTDCCKQQYHHRKEPTQPLFFFHGISLHLADLLRLFHVCFGYNVMRTML